MSYIVRRRLNPTSHGERVYALLLEQAEKGPPGVAEWIRENKRIAMMAIEDVFPAPEEYAEVTPAAPAPPPALVVEEIVEEPPRPEVPVVREEPPPPVDVVDPPVQTATDDETMTARYTAAESTPGNPFQFVARFDGQDEVGAFGRTINGVREVRFPLTVDVEGTETEGFQVVRQKQDGSWEISGFAPKTGRKIKAPPTAESVSDFTVEEAMKWVQEAAAMLASLPSVGSRDNYYPDGTPDDVGLSGSTDGPIRTFVGEVADGTSDVNKAFAAASYLRQHSKSQLDRAEWEHAYNRLKLAAEIEEETAKALLKGRGGHIIGQDKGSVNQGGKVLTYEFLDDALYLTNLSGHGVSMKTRHLPDGARWSKTSDGEFVLRVDAGAIPALTEYIAPGFPVLAPVLKAKQDRWVAQAEAAHAPPVLSEEERAAEEVLHIDMEKAAKALYRRFESFVNARIRFKGGRSSEGPDEAVIADYIQRLVPHMPQLLQVSDGLPAVENAREVPDEGEFNARMEPGELRELSGGSNVAHFRYMFPVLREGRRSPGWGTAMARDALFLSWSTRDGKILTDPALDSWKPRIWVRSDKMAREGWSWMRNITQGKYLRSGGKARPSWAHRATASFPLDRAAPVARALDLAMPSLAMALRKALLSNVQTRECPELEVLSRAPSITDIEDPEVARKVEEIVGKLKFPGGLAPYGYQKVGIAYIVLANYRGLIADQPGLGKTMQAIGVLATDPKRLTPCLVVCPAAVMTNWLDAFEKWMPQLRTEIWHAEFTKRQPKPEANTVTIITWGRLRRDLDKVVGLYRYVIFDESHKAKNPRAGVAQAANKMARKTPAVVLLTGTPLYNPKITENEEGEVEGNPQDLWNQIDMVAADEVGSFQEFRAKYSSGSNREFDSGQGEIRQRQVDGKADLDELAQELRCYMIRRTLDDTGRDRPKILKTEMPVYLTGSLRDGYNRLIEEIIAFSCAAYRERITRLAARLTIRLVREGLTVDDAVAQATGRLNEEDFDPQKSGGNMLAKLTRLREYVGKAKAAMLVPWIKEFVSTGRGLLVFAYHGSVLKTVTDALTEEGVPYGTIVGGQSQKSRAEARRKFERGQIPVMVISTAGGTGVDGLQYGADTLLMLERLWVPAEEEQIEARLDRTGQTKPVTVYYPFARGTVDERMTALVSAKAGIVDQVIRSAEVDEKVSTKVTDKADDIAAKLILAELNRKIREGSALECFAEEEDVKAAYEALVEKDPRARGLTERGIRDIFDAPVVENPRPRRFDDILRRSTTASNRPQLYNAYRWKK